MQNSEEVKKRLKKKMKKRDDKKRKKMKVDSASVKDLGRIIQNKLK